MEIPQAEKYYKMDKINRYNLQVFFIFIFFKFISIFYSINDILP